MEVESILRLLGGPEFRVFVPKGADEVELPAIMFLEHFPELT